MLYGDLDNYTPNLKYHKDYFMLLDVSLISRTHFLEYFGKRAGEIGCDQHKLRQRFQDTLISSTDLQTKLSAVILPYSCSQRQFKPVDQVNLYPNNLTPFQYLIKKYQNSLIIGMKIELGDTQLLQTMKALPYFKKIKLFSFQLHEQCIEQQLPLLRKCLLSLFDQSSKSKSKFHINATLKSSQCLKTIKHQFISHGYPIQFISLQTNLLNIIQSIFNLSVLYNEQQLGFKYVQTINKYVPAAIGAVIDFYQLEQECSWQLCDRIFATFNNVNRISEKGLKEYRSYHNTGIAVNEAVLMYLAKGFTTDECQHFKVKSLLDTLCWNKMYDAAVGKYKASANIAEQQTNKEQGTIEEMEIDQQIQQLKFQETELYEVNQ